MSRLGFASLALLVFASAVHAQPGTTYPYNLNLYGPGLVSPYNSSFTRPGPNLSPYLNLLRGGNPAANYYLGVVPEIERRSNAAAFSAGIQDLSRRIESPALEASGEELFPALPQTGHPVQFFNYSYYFGSGTRAAAQQPGQAGVTPVPPRRR
jgi:hypothetical protein